MGYDPFLARIAVLFKSTDGGLTWQASDDGMRQVVRTVRALAIDPRRTSVLYAGTPGGVYKTPNGGRSWLPASNGIGTREVLALAVSPSNSRLVYAGTQRHSDAFVSALDPTGSQLLYSTYLGGSDDEEPFFLGAGSIAVDSFGSVLVAGSTASGDFPLLGHPVQDHLEGDIDAFVARFGNLR
jgi:DNA-binding beta-propeller fold protein YncE